MGFKRLKKWCKGNYGLYFSVVGSSNTGKKIGFFYKTQRLSWLAEKYLASLDGFCYKERIIEWSGVICLRRPRNIILLLVDVSEQLSDPTKACRQFGVFIEGSALMKIFQPNTTNSKIETNHSSSLKMRTAAHSYLHSI